MKKGIILSIICLVLLSGCGSSPKLKDGKEVVISFSKDEKNNITAEELYEELKNNYGLEATLKLADTYILEKEFEDYTSKAKELAENNIKAYIDMWGGEEEFLKAVRNNTNFSTIDAYKESIYVNNMENHALEEYAKTLVTDKEIEKYYKDTVKGDIEVYHILITPDVKDDMTSTEKAEEENKAKDTINDIIKKLDKAKNKLETFKELVKEYSEDASTKEVDGNLGYLNFGDLDSTYDELLNTAYKLKDGEYSKSVITTSLGYHVVYRNATKEKDKLEDIKDTIIETLSEKKLSEITDIAVDSAKYYREKYGMEINDSTLKRQYGIYLNNLRNNSK